MVPGELAAIDPRCAPLSWCHCSFLVAPLVVVCVWGHLSGPVALGLSLPPLCTFCHRLSPSSLPLERSPVWEPQSVHRGKSSAGNHTQIRRSFINTQNPPQYCSLKGSWEVGFVFMQNDHLPSSLVQIFHHSQMKSCCFTWAIDWLVSLCFIGNIEFWAVPDRDVACREVFYPATSTV